jgi:hypothetical protein
VTHSVNNSSGVAARWYEFRSQRLVTTSLSLYQSGQTPDDGHYRGVGSVDMDQMGDIAIGYSRSSAASLVRGNWPSISRLYPQAQLQADSTYPIRVPDKVSAEHSGL